ncbi:hypothetical protein [Rathayibacter sp. VKM Ac-2630]|uniref:hypothetical protein n=1 Tax=Rathayibacter sp. VKM Ac-2630 TaxID=1938617 RepID=UPI00111599C1|nr:hypothetical protein [Rathayibacter sp. VKM Ac-2630]
MSHHWTPMSMVSRSVTPGEWRMGDKREELGWIRLVDYAGVPTYVCVTRDELVVGGGDTLPDAARAFLAWARSDGDSPVVEGRG